MTVEPGTIHSSGQNSRAKAAAGWIKTKMKLSTEY